MISTYVPYLKIGISDKGGTMCPPPQVLIGLTILTNIVTQFLGAIYVLINQHYCDVLISNEFNEGWLSRLWISTNDIDESDNDICDN